MPELIGGVRLQHVVTEKKQNYSSGKPFASYIDDLESKPGDLLKRDFSNVDRKLGDHCTQAQPKDIESFHALPLENASESIDSVMNKDKYDSVGYIVDYKYEDTSNLSTANDFEHVFTGGDEFIELTNVYECDDDNKLNVENELSTSSILSGVKVVNDDYNSSYIAQDLGVSGQPIELEFIQSNRVLPSINGCIDGEIPFVSGDVNADDLNYSIAFPAHASGGINVGSLNDSTQSTLTHDYINPVVTQSNLQGATSSSSDYIYNELYMLKNKATGHLDQKVIRRQSNQLSQVAGNIEQNHVLNRGPAIEKMLSIDKKVKLNMRLTRDLVNSIVNLKSVNNSESSNSERVGKFTPLISAELKRIDPQLKRNLSFVDGNNGGVKVYLRDYGLPVEELLLELLPLLSLLPNAEAMPIQVVINGTDVTDSVLKQINRGGTNAS